MGLFKLNVESESKWFVLGVGLSKLEAFGHVDENRQVTINKFLKRATNHTSSITSCPTSITSQHFPSTPSLHGSDTSGVAPVKSLPSTVAPVTDQTTFKSDPVTLVPASISEHQAETLTCPICRASYSPTNTSLQKFNEHIDTCLNRQKIREILSEQKQIENEKRSLKRKSKKDLATSSSAKRTLELFFKKR